MIRKSGVTTVRFRTHRLSGMLLFLSIILGCQPKQAQTPPKETPVVPVSYPVQRMVTDYVDYTGRTDAVQTVSVRPQVTGQLIPIAKPFIEGDEVKENDILFEIDPRPYQATYDQAKSQLGISESQQKLAKITLDRDRSLDTSKAVADQQIDQDRASLAAADNRVKNSQAALDAADLNLKFTKVRAPISGRISRYYYTPGNTAMQNQTILTTIVTMDPMYVYFDMDDRTRQRYQQILNEQKKKDPSPSESKSKAKVLMELEGEKNYPHTGTIDFINNQVNPSTGTLAVRGVFNNTRYVELGAWQMVPGMFVRVRLPLGEPHPALLVIDRAIRSDQGLKYVYVVDSESKVQTRRVQTGALQEDGLRVIEPFDPKTGEGLKPDDVVVVGAIQQLRPRTVVKTDAIAMPTTTGDLAPTDQPKPKAKSK